MTGHATLTHDLPCTACGYNLRGVDRSGLCPECGEAVGVSITLRREPVGPTLANVGGGDFFMAVFAGILGPLFFVLNLRFAMMYDTNLPFLLIAGEAGLPMLALLAAAVVSLVIVVLTRGIGHGGVLAGGVWMGAAIMLQWAVCFGIGLFIVPSGQPLLRFAALLLLAAAAAVLAFTVRDLLAPPIVYLARRRLWGLGVFVAGWLVAAVGSFVSPHLHLLELALLFVPVWGLLTFCLIGVRVYHTPVGEGRPPIDRRAVVGWAAAYAAAWGVALVLAL